MEHFLYFFESLIFSEPLSLKNETNWWIDNFSLRRVGINQTFYFCSGFGSDFEVALKNGRSAPGHAKK